MDYIALAGVNCFLKRKKKLRNLVFVSLISSVFSLLLHIYIKDSGIRTIILHFVLNTAMACLAFGWSGRKKFLEDWLFIYLTILFLGGIMEWEGSLGVPTMFFWIKALIAAVLLSAAAIYFSQKKEFLEQVFSVEIEHRGKKTVLTGYWDSGNLLVDPYVKRPVNILCEKAAEKIFSQEEENIRLIPYVSLGNTKGLLRAYEAEVMYICQGSKKIEIRPAVFGIAEEGLLDGKEYDLILQASMLERES